MPSSAVGSCFSAQRPDLEAALAPGAQPLPLALGRAVAYDTDNFDAVEGLTAQQIGSYPTRMLVQVLLAGVGPNVLEAVRTDNVYPYAAGAEVPTSEQVLEARGTLGRAPYAPTPFAAEAARRGVPIVTIREASTLIEQRDALRSALNWPTLQASSATDVGRVLRLYEEIDEPKSAGPGGHRSGPHVGRGGVPADAARAARERAPTADVARDGLCRTRRWGAERQGLA